MLFDVHCGPLEVAFLVNLFFVNGKFGEKSYKDLFAPIEKESGKEVRSL